MLKKFQTVIILWLLLVFPFYGALKYIELSSTDSVYSCLETVLSTENKNVVANISERISRTLKLYELYIQTLDSSKIKDERYIAEFAKNIPCKQKNLIRMKISDDLGSILYTSDRYESGDFLHDQKFKDAKSGTPTINLMSLDQKSKSIGISYFFSVMISKDNKRVFVEIVNPFSYIDKYISSIDPGIFPRFFYIISPEFTRYISMSGIFVSDSEKPLCASLGCHLAKEIQKSTTDGNKVFFTNGKAFSMHVQEIKLKEVNAPKLFAVVAAHADSIARLSDELIGGIPLSTIFVLICAMLIAISLSRIHLKIKSKLQISNVISRSTPIPVIVFDLATGTVIETNKPSSILFQIPLEKFTGINAWTLFAEQDDIEYIKNAMTSDFPVQNYEVMMKKQSSTSFWCILSVNPIKINGDLYVILGAYDISHRKDLELKLEHNAKTLELQVQERTKAIEEQSKKLEENNRKLEESMQAADKANESKSKFLLNVANELKLPLESIKNSCELLIEEAQQRHDSTSEDDLNKIIHESEGMMSMVNDIMDISNIERGETTISNDDFDVCDLMHDIENSTRALFSDGNVNLALDCPENIGMMRSDRKKLTRCILNLISSAKRKTETGEVTVVVREGFVDNEDYIEFLVKDTGAGMTLEALTRLQDAFNSSTNAQEEDIEIGLSTVNKYCKALGATVAINSTEDDGSEFTLQFPRVGTNASDNEETDTQKKKQRSKRKSPNADKSETDSDKEQVSEKYTSITFDVE